MRLYAPNVLIPNAPPVGLTLTRINDSTVTVAAGAVPIRDRTSPIANPRYTMAYLPSALTKTQSLWAAGNNQGARFGSAGGTGSTTHFFLIRDRATGLVDVGSDTNADGSQIPDTFDIRMIGSVKRPTESNDFIGFMQHGNFFVISQTIELLTGSLSVSPNSLVTLSGIPGGISVRPLLRVDITPSSAGTNVFIAGFSAMMAAAINSSVTTTHRVITSEYFTNTNRAIRLWADAPNTAIALLTLGYYHPLDFYW